MVVKYNITFVITKCLNFFHQTVVLFWKKKGKKYWLFYRQLSCSKTDYSHRQELSALIMLYIDGVRDIVEQSQLEDAEHLLIGNTFLILWCGNAKSNWCLLCNWRCVCLAIIRHSKWRRVNSACLEQVDTFFCVQSYILRVSDQNGVSLLYIMLEIHHSGREPSNYMTMLQSHLPRLHYALVLYKHFLKLQAYS